MSTCTSRRFSMSSTLEHQQQLQSPVCVYTGCFQARYWVEVIHVLAKYASGCAHTHIAQMKHEPIWGLCRQLYVFFLFHLCHQTHMSRTTEKPSWNSFFVDTPLSFNILNKLRYRHIIWHLHLHALWEYNSCIFVAGIACFFVKLLEPQWQKVHLLLCFLRLSQHYCHVRC